MVIYFTIIKISRNFHRDRGREFMVAEDKLELLHLLFANDTILFLHDDNRSIRNVITLIQVFEILGLEINLGKRSHKN